MTHMDELPTVISCCFCCFLRAGSIVISLISFLTGIIFIPNISHSPGFWDMDNVLLNFGAVTESVIQVVLGCASLLLCMSSVLLFMGVCFNMINLILLYQYGAVLYSGTLFLILLVLSTFCFFVYTDCMATGAVFVFMMVLDVLCTMYFVIVTNSLRLTMKDALNDNIP